MTLTRHLNTLESTGLIHLAQAQPELEYLFRHALVQDAAYHSLVKQDRRQLHRSVGEALERMYPDRIEELVPLLAQHFDQAGDDERALTYYAVAGDHAAHRYANAEAVTHYTRAIQLARGVARRGASPAVDDDRLVTLYLKRGRALQLNSRYREALDNYADLETLGRERNNRTIELSALMESASIYSTPTSVYDTGLGERLSQQTLALAREIGDRRAEAKSLWNLLLLYTLDGRARKAIEHGLQSLAIAREHGLQEQVAFTLHDLGGAYMFAGQLEAGLAALNESSQLWRAMNNQPMRADSLTTSALILYYLGRLEQAIARADEGLRISRSIENLWGQSYSAGLLAYPLWELGRMGEAAAAWEESVRLGEPSGLIAALIGIRSDLAWAYGSLGAVDRGLDQARLAFTKAGSQMTAWQPWPAAVMARLHLLQGDVSKAESALAQSRQLLSHKGFNQLLRSGWVALHLADGELAMLKGDHAHAARIADDLCIQLRGMSAGTFVPDALLLKGKALLAQGRVDDAHTALVEARVASEAIGSRRTQWPILAALSEVEARCGDQAEAQALRRQARAIVEFIAEHLGVPDPSTSSGLDLRASFLNLPDVQSVMRDT